MSVIGFDIGNESCVIAVAKRGGIDVLMNHESKRETPAVVSFGDKQRFLGSPASNPKSTISHIKRLIGKLFNDDLKSSLPFVTREGPRGGVLIELEYLKEKWTFTPVEILGMLFKHLKQIAEKNLKSHVVDCVIGIPSYFTDLQRRQYLDAASIAGLKPLRLIHDGTAIALAYGMYKIDFPDSGSGPGPTIVMFVDIGHCDTQVTIVAFEPGQMKILSHSFDPDLGGRDFDEVLYKHFAAQFTEKYSIDVCANARASMRLRAACEKVKKVLSVNTEAPISIDCLIGDTDVRGVITREEFENLSSQLLQRVTIPCIKGLQNSGLSVDQIYTVELVGSGSRIPAITRILTLFFKREPMRTLNASECVARGCALQCAMLSPSLHVRDYKVQDWFPYSIVAASNHEFVLFPKGSSFPKEMEVNYISNTELLFELTYSNEMNFPAGISPMVGSFRIGRPEPSDAENAEVKFKVLLNDHGIIKIGSARILQHNAYTWKTTAKSLQCSENLQVSTTRAELREAQKKEKILAEQDVKVEKCKDQRNTLESFVYETRSKLSSAYKSFATDSEKVVVLNRLSEIEGWLYEDSDDESEQDYTGRLEHLQTLLKPIENKYYENDRMKAQDALLASLANYRKLADELPDSMKDMVKSECTKVNKWLIKFSQEKSSPKILSSYMNRAIKDFESNCEHIMRSKPSFPRDDDEPSVDVDSNKKEQPGDLDEREHPGDLDEREVPVDYMDTEQSNHHYDEQVQKPNSLDLLNEPST